MSEHESTWSGPRPGGSPLTPKLTPALLNALAAIAAATPADATTHVGPVGVTGRSLARALWPESPGWSRRNARGASNHPGSLGGTMPMLGARTARRLVTAGLVDIEYSDVHQPFFSINPTGRSVLAAQTRPAPATD